ncbi:endolysin [Mycobacterium phage Ekdilam]|uniref:Tape measure protein n=1 Tax=Mycobacterium phage Ekdilam TaxID=2599862 RepID=A0A5J6TRX2_9CAUD|nr:endolysin [Mycobacterium phage Ekdilam]QFG11442.1 tape measure protein [Mycobacterium phage Ekdilam]
MSATYYLTVLPETSKLVPGINQAMRSAEKGATITPKFDTRGAEQAGRQAGRDVQAGIDSSARGGGIGRFLRADGARSVGQQAGNEVNAGLQSADIGRGLGSQLAANLGNGAMTLGRNVGSMIATGLKATAIVGGTVAAAGIAGALHAGMSRLTAIDDAKFKLQGLGNDTQKVQNIMDNALEAVRGTAFGLDEAATTAASAVAAGIAPGVQLTDYLKLTADTAAIAGTSLADMGSIFNKVQTSGKAFTGDLNMLADRGLPVFTWLQEEYKVSGEELSKMVEKGKVDAATFQRVVAERIGGAAQNMGGSIRGQLSNLKASYSRFGAELAGPIFAAVSPMALTLTGAFDKITAAIKPKLEQLTAVIGPWATDMGNKVTAWLDGGGVQRIMDFFGRLVDKVQALRTGEGRSDALQSIADSAKALGPALKDAGPALQGVGAGMKAFAMSIAEVGPQTLTAVLTPALQLLAGSLRFLADNASWAVPAIAGLVVAFAGFKAIGSSLSPLIGAINGAFKIVNTPMMIAQTRAISAQTAAMTQLTAAMGANAGAQATQAAAANVNAVANGRGRLASLGSAIAMRAQAVATRAVTAAQWLMNAAMTANPIGIIIAAVVAVGVALWAFFTKTETGRKLWDKIWTGIKTTALTVWEWLKSTLGKAWETLGPGLSKLGQIGREAFDALSGAVGKVWKFIQPAVEWIGRLWLAVAKLEFKAAIAALKGLGSIIGWLWTNVVVPAFDGIVAAVSVWWEVTKAIWSGASDAIGWVGDKVMWLWRNVAVPAFDAIGTVVSTWWGGVKVVWDLFTTALDKIGKGVGVFKDGIVGAFNAVKDVVTSVWSSIGGIWDKIVNGIGTVTDALKGAGGKVLGALGLSGGATGGFVSGGLPGYANGGRISGPGTGTSDSILGFPAMVRVANGEFITNARATAENLPLLMAMNAGTPLWGALKDMLPGLAGGGLAAGKAAEGNLQGNSVLVSRLISQMFPAVGTIGGYRPNDSYPDHPSGRALDIMIPDWQSDSGMALGNSIMSFLMQNADALGVDYTIWRQTYRSASGNSNLMEDRGGNTQNHMDHVHVTTKAGNPAGGISAVPAGLKMPAGATNPLDGMEVSGSGAIGSATGTGSYRTATSSELSSSSTKVDNARTQAKNADQSVDDRTYAVEKAQRRVDELRAAGKDTADAQHRLDVANRELADAKERQAKAHDKVTKAEGDDAELRTKGKQTKGSGSSKDGGLSGADFGKTFVSGVLESIGLDGSLFSNPLEWPTIKSLMAGLNFAGGLLKGGDSESGGPGGFANGAADAVGLGGLLSAIPGGVVDPGADWDPQSGSPNLAPGQFNLATGGGGGSLVEGALNAMSAFAPAGQQQGQPDPAASGQGGGDVVFSGNVGMDPAALRGEFRNEMNSRRRYT